MKNETTISLIQKIEKIRSNEINCQQDVTDFKNICDELSVRGITIDVNIYFSDKQSKFNENITLAKTTEYNPNEDETELDGILAGKLRLHKYKNQFQKLNEQSQSEFKSKNSSKNNDSKIILHEELKNKLQLTADQIEELMSYPNYWRPILRRAAEQGESISEAYKRLEKLEYLM